MKAEKPLRNGSAYINIDYCADCAAASIWRKESKPKAVIAASGTFPILQLQHLTNLFVEKLMPRIALNVRWKLQREVSIPCSEARFSWNMIQIPGLPFLKIFTADVAKGQAL
jgi:hypothetical protein